MKGPKISSLIKLSVLLLLANEGKKHGYEIIKNIEKKTGKKISPGEIYPFLKNLKKYDLVVTKKSGTREKKVYSLTKSGKIFVKEILNKFDTIIDNAVKSRLRRCTHCKCEIYKGGFSKTIKGRQMIFCCSACAKMYK